MTDARQVSDQADLPHNRNQDTLDSTPRNPTKRSTRPLFLFHTTTFEPVGHDGRIVDRLPQK